MDLSFYKIFEDEKKVFYRVETTAYEKTNVGVKGRLVKACCMFDKITKILKFDPEKTDSFFCERKDERLMIELHLNDLSKRQMGFPDKSFLCTGG